MNDSNMRVRFAPSPTGYLHIGGARTVLFNWLLARKHGGTFVLRIEDTDRNRHVEDSVAKILEDLRWLGLNWDEGPEVGGEYGSYFQSERLDIYNQYADQLLRSGHAYYAFETPQELEAMRERAKGARRNISYERPSPLPTIEQGLAAKATGRPAVIRLKTPGESVTVSDDLLGEVTVSGDQIEDFVIVKSDGFPTYHFACVVDDELMKITHVLRGQEHLMNTPKHILLQRALGFATPRYAHLPVIFNMDGSKMSKRDKEKALKAGLPPPEIEVHDFRVSGYLPEAILNFIALLGWSPGAGATGGSSASADRTSATGGLPASAGGRDATGRGSPGAASADRERFDLQELTQLFSIERVGKTNAKFDREKLLAFNTEWAARLSPERLREAFRSFLTANVGRAMPADTNVEHVVPAGANVGRAMPAAATTGLGSATGDLGATGGLSASVSAAAPVFETLLRQSDATLKEVLRVCAGFRTLADVVKKAGFLFLLDDAIAYDDKAVAKVLAKNNNAGFSVLENLLPQLESLQDWSSAGIDALIASICERQQLKMGDVAQPLRVAVSGSTISPAIGETLALLGRERTMTRIRRCLSER